MSDRSTHLAGNPDLLDHIHWLGVKLDGDEPALLHQSRQAA